MLLQEEFGSNHNLSFFFFFKLFPENYREGDSQETDITVTERRGRIQSDAFTI